MLSRSSPPYEAEINDASSNLEKGTAGTDWRFETRLDQKSSGEPLPANGVEFSPFLVSENTMVTAAVLEPSELTVTPAMEAAPEQAPIMTLSSYRGKLTREQLSRVSTPSATATHKPIPHIQVVEKLIEALSFRQIGVVREEYAVSSDGMKMFVWISGVPICDWTEKEP